MIKKFTTSNLLATGFAVFSMLFGAGNVVFPLALGAEAKSANIYAILGLLITAVGVPCLGLISMIFYDGNYDKFFSRIGKTPGYIVTFFLMCLIGPFGAMPRILSLSYSTVTMFWSPINIYIFSAISCLLVLIFTIRETKILDILGYFLTPFLLASLFFIIIKGFLYSPVAPTSEIPAITVFFEGLLKGYQTMDLPGAIFFSSIVLVCLHKNLDKEESNNKKRVAILALQASLIGASLLAIIYTGMSYVAAFNSLSIEGVAPDKLIGTLALDLMGPMAGIVACAAVALACLTTAIALTAVFSEFLHYDVFMGKIGYLPSLIITLIITFIFSTSLQFVGMMAFLAPILQIIYPSLIVLSVVNLAYKIFGFKPVKGPVYATFILSLLLTLVS